MARERKNRLINDIIERELRVAAAIHARGRLIDIGCGEKPYREIFAPHVAEHVGVDHAETLHSMEAVDLVGTAYAIPVDDGTFDTGLCTAVLEHLEEPEAAIRECSRALGLPTWDKPAMACLASRIPHGIPVTIERLGQVEAAEAALRGLGFRQVRVRHHEAIARSEVPPEERTRLLDPALAAARPPDPLLSEPTGPLLATPPAASQTPRGRRRRFPRLRTARIPSPDTPGPPGSARCRPWGTGWCSPCRCAPAGAG